MKLTDLRTVLKAEDMGREMYHVMAELYPFCRSITGDGVRQTLEVLRQQIPLAMHEVPSGTKVFDWTVPKEWNIKDAYIKDSRGRKVIDFAESNLHVVSYSVPVNTKISLKDLKEHLFTLPDSPDWIPYRTSYYTENWGFCLAHKKLESLENGEYEVFIDSSLQDGHMTYGEYVLRGASADEVVISCHVCHPSLCNDNLSGIVLATFLAKYLNSVSLKHTYRFLFIPGTIGSITWLAQNEELAPRIKHGLVFACVGDSGRFTYKKSRRGNAEIDTAMIQALRDSGKEFEIVDFSPYGYDERQFCSPGFNLPVGCFMRTCHGRFPEYHTSADNLDFVQPTFLADSWSQCLSVLDILESNGTYVNQNPDCEPQLGKRGLYHAIGGGAGQVNQLALLWVLNLSDGQHTLLDIAGRSGLDFQSIRRAADALLAHELLRAN